MTHENPELEMPIATQLAISVGLGVASIAASYISIRLFAAIFLSGPMGLGAGVLIGIGSLCVFTALPSYLSGRITGGVTGPRLLFLKAVLVTPVGYVLCYYIVRALGASPSPGGTWYYLQIVALFWLIMIPFSHCGCRHGAAKWAMARKGNCKGCGYDLTGNVTGRCSECGKLLTRQEAVP